MAHQGTKILYHDLNKFNKNPILARCAYCLELSRFRVVQITDKQSGNLVNSLACTRCLRSARFYKTEHWKNNRMIHKGAFTKEQKLQRLIMRSYRFIVGDSVVFPLNIKRRSKLGVFITNIIIKVKGLLK